MKKFAKIFVAVAGLFVGFACTTDVTEDLGVQLGGGAGQTTVTLSLEESRTSLGAAANGLYPVVWSGDDAISINGVKSSSIAVGSNAATATFTFNTSLSYPYCVAYPAAAEGKVVFADQQIYTDGTFNDGAAAMYGYAEAAGGLSLKHLTGVLKIGVTGSKTLSFAQISTADRTPIAGEFDIDFTTGDVTPTKNAKELISYSFPEDLVLASVPQYIYVAVPAGVYDELYVTLYDTEGGVMYATVKASDNKPLVAGKVREFSNAIPYEANASVFVVKDKTSLQAFAAEAATLNKDVLFVADVDMTGEAWTPIEGYAKTVLGNGYAIKGLTAPLFGITNASIKGLHLRDVNINETENPNIGALARQITATADIDPVVEHCSVSGKISVHTPNRAWTKGVDTNYLSFSISGVVGALLGSTMHDCVNHADIDVKQIVVSSNATEFSTVVGGVAGYVNVFSYAVGEETKTKLSYISNLENTGNISFHDTSYTGETNVSTYGKLKPMVAGVVGCLHSGNIEAPVSNVTNRGNVTASGNYGNGMNMGGVFGYYATHDGSNFNNYGKVSYLSGATRYAYISGVLGYSHSTSVSKNIHNHGEVYLAKDATFGSIIAGGLIGYQGSPAFKATDAGTDITADSSNNGPINIFCKGFDPSLHTTTSLYFRIGGLSGWTQHVFYNCENTAKGVITCHTDVYNVDTSKYAVCVGGLVGYKTVNAIIDSENNAKINVNINLTTKEDAATTDLDNVRFNYGGVVGFSNLPIMGCTNNGAVELSGSYAGQVRMGGVAGQVNGVSTELPLCYDCVNNGPVTIKEKTNLAYQIYFGGVFGYCPNNENHTNNGAVTIEKDVTIAQNAYIGGVMGYFGKAGTKSYNNGAVTLNDGITAGGEFHLGGVHGYAVANSSYAENTGAVTVGNVTFNCSGGNRIGGVFGSVTEAATLIEHATNRGAVVSNGENTVASHYVGGIAGYFIEKENSSGKLVAPKTDYLDNYGTVTVSCKKSYRMNVGGIAAYVGGTSNFLTNHKSGTITVNGETTNNTYASGVATTLKDHSFDCLNEGDIIINSTIGGTLYASGSVTVGNNYKRTRHTNKGNITLNGTVKGNCFIGGMTYDTGFSMSWIDCHNEGNLIMSESATVTGQSRWGGLVGKLEGATVNIYDGCSNSGDIIIKGTVSNFERYAGLLGCHTSGTVIVLNGFTNSGDIIYQGKNTTTNGVHLGGVIGISSTTKGKTAPVYSNDANPTWTGNVINTGTIKFAGEIGGNVRMGGFCGLMNAGAAPSGAYLINFGDLEASGTVANMENTQVGGIVGGLVVPLENTQSYCNIKALGWEKVGIITGVTRTSGKPFALNAKVGGTICNTVKFNGDTFQDEPVVITLDASNYTDHIYGSADWTGVEGFDGCSFLTSKDAVTYYPVAETPAE